MSGKQYLKNQILPIFVNLMGMLALSLFLLANGNPIQTVVFIFIVWLIILIAYLSITYYMRKRYLNKLLDMTEQLEERYLIPEIMTIPDKADEQVFYQIMKMAEEEINSFLTEHTSVVTDGGTLNISEQSYYEEAMGETVYNSYTNVVYVLPDNICEKLLPVIQNHYITTTEKITYENARELEKLFTAEYPEATENGGSYNVRFSTLQINSTIANNFILQAAMLYGAVVLMVICLTVLSLQQLLDAGQYKYRFSVLRKLGVEEKRIGKLVLKQLGVWFGLPIIVAIVVAAVVTAYFIQTISAEISAYIGYTALLLQVGTTIGILAVLLICYFLSTWVLFRKSVNL